MSFHKEGGDFALHQAVTITPEVKIEGEEHGNKIQKRNGFFGSFQSLLSWSKVCKLESSFSEA